MQSLPFRPELSGMANTNRAQYGCVEKKRVWIHRTHRGNKTQELEHILADLSVCLD